MPTLIADRPLDDILAGAMPPGHPPGGGGGGGTGPGDSPDPDSESEEEEEEGSPT